MRSLGQTEWALIALPALDCLGYWVTAFPSLCSVSVGPSRAARSVPPSGTVEPIDAVAGALADRVGYRAVLSSGLLVETIGMAWLAVVAGDSPSYSTLVVPLIVTGVGTSAALPVTQAAIIAAVGDRDIGKAAGVNNMFQELGGAFGVAVGVAVFSTAGSDLATTDVADGFVGAMTVAVTLAAVAFCLSLSIPRSGRR